MQDNIRKRFFLNRNRVENLSVISYNKIKNSVQLNWMMEKGAFTYDEETGTYKVHFDKFRDAVKGLSQALLDIQRKGSYEEGAKFLDKYAQVPSHLTTSLKKLYEIPIDIYPEFEK